MACAKCSDLEREVARLRSLLKEHNIDADAERHVQHENVPPLRLEIPDVANPLRRSHSILIRRESGRIQCLRDVLDDLTPPTNVIETARRNSRLARASLHGPPETSELKQPLNAKEITADELQSTRASEDRVKEKARENARLSTNNQDPESTALSVSSLNGIEDRSLGDLFKYAIVLTGPMAKPKKSALSAFFKNSDFRRAKPIPDNSGMNGDGSRKASLVEGTNDKPGSIASNKSTEELHQEPSNATSTPPPFTLQEIVSPDAKRTNSGEVSKVPPPGSPMKRPGWLSNIVPPRFRSGSNDTPPILHTRPNDSAADLSAPGPNLKSVASQPVPKIDPTKPRMIAVSPPPSNDGVAELEGLLELCFPYGQKLPPLSDFSVANLRRTLQERHRTYRSPDSTFVLTIASVKSPSEITYAVCVHMPLFPDDESGTGPENVDADGEKLPAHGCISLLSNYPFFSLFFKVVFGIASIWESRRKEYVQDYVIALKEKKAPPAALTIRDFVEHFEGVMNRMKDMRVPAMGGWTRVLLAPQYTPLSFHRPHSENVTAERRMLVLEYAAPMLFAQLSVDQVLFLLGCLCCERKVLVVSDHANIVSSCVLALITLLEPLQWAGPVITLLPPRLDELLEAPVPLIAGRVSVNSASIANFSTLTKPMNGVIEMNMDQNNLCMHEEDLMLYHELKLPGCDALVHELQHFSSQLFECHLSPDYPSAEQTQACDSICSRIHRHMQSICSLATGEATSLDVSSPLYCVSPRRQATGSTSDPVWTRRCSEAVQDYIRRFQDTQMFTMLKLQRQEERADAADDDDDDDDGDDSDEPMMPRRSDAKGRAYERGEGAVGAGDTDTLFVDEEAVTYPTAV